MQCSRAGAGAAQLALAAMAVVGRWRKLGSRRPGAAFRLSGACQSGWHPIILQSPFPLALPSAPVCGSPVIVDSWCGVQEQPRPQLMSTRCPRDRTFFSPPASQGWNYSSTISSGLNKNGFTLPNSSQMLRVYKIQIHRRYRSKGKYIDLVKLLAL